MKHKFIICSDTHGMAPVVPHGLDENGCVAWLHGGDFYNRLRKPPKIKDYGPADGNSSATAHLGTWLSARPIPVHMVRGNHDVMDPENAHGRFGIEGNVVEVAPGLFVAGIGWSGGAFFDLPLERDLAPVCRDVIRAAMLKMSGKDRLVILSHYPAWIKEVYEKATGGMDPEGWLFECVRDVMEKLTPVALVSGHIHEFFGQHAKHNGIILTHPGPSPIVLEVDMDSGQAGLVIPK